MLAHLAVNTATDSAARSRTTRASLKVSRSGDRDTTPSLSYATPTPRSTSVFRSSRSPSSITIHVGIVGVLPQRAERRPDFAVPILAVLGPIET